MKTIHECIHAVVVIYNLAQMAIKYLAFHATKEDVFLSTGKFMPADKHISSHCMHPELKFLLSFAKILAPKKLPQIQAGVVASKGENCQVGLHYFERVWLLVLEK